MRSGTQCRTSITHKTARFCAHGRFSNQEMPAQLYRSRPQALDFGEIHDYRSFARPSTKRSRRSHSEIACPSSSPLPAPALSSAGRQTSTSFLSNPSSWILLKIPIEKTPNRPHRPEQNQPNAPTGPRCNGTLPYANKSSSSWFVKTASRTCLGRCSSRRTSSTRNSLTMSSGPSNSMRFEPAPPRS